MLKKLSKNVEKFASFLEQVNKAVAIALMVVLICIVFFQVSSRVFTGKSFVWIEELSIVLAAWLGFLTLAYSAKRTVHVRIDVFSSKLPQRAQEVLSTVICLCTLIAAVYLVRYGWQIAMRKMRVPLMVLPFPSGVQYVSFPVGMALLVVYLFDHLLEHLVKALDKGEA